MCHLCEISAWSQGSSIHQCYSEPWQSRALKAVPCSEVLHWDCRQDGTYGEIQLVRLLQRVSTPALLCWFGSRGFLEWAHKERKYQDTSQYVAWFNRMHGSSNSTDECLESETVILSPRFVFKSINCDVCNKTMVLATAAVLLCPDTHQWIFAYGQGLGIIYAVSCGYPSNQTHWWTHRKHDLHKTFRCLGI